MKRLYLILAAAAVVISGMAATPKASPYMETPVSVSREPRNIRADLPAIGNKSTGSAARMRIREIRKADSDFSNPEGTWTVIYEDTYYPEGATGELVYVEYSVSLDKDGYLFFEPYDSYYIGFFLLWNETESTMTLEQMFIGYADFEVISQEPFYNNYIIGERVWPESMTYDYDKQGGYLIFTEDCGIAWGAYDYFTGDYLGDYDGYYFMDAYVGEAPDVPAPEDKDWKAVGDALFMDGWVLPAFEIDQTLAANQYKVPLQRNVDNPNRFRLVDPYHLGPIADRNESVRPGYIVFDVTDPEHVLFEYADAGFAFKEFGISQFFCYNMLGMYKVFFEEYTVQELVNRLGDRSPWTTFKDGIVSLSYIMKDGEKEYDANFGDQWNPWGGFDWKSAFGNTWSGNMSASITFPEGWENASVGTIGDVDEAEAEYYTVDGVKVAAPAKGMLLIERRGTTARKIMF